ncbi:hypothetical protein HYV84_08305, partial [Candidatus Woesearchaeota archaeon]|nr:hypothetical protein [Candidatus Woesearchaeota archaeon]
MKQGKPLLAVMLAFLFLSYPFAVAEEISLSYDANGNLLRDEKNLYVYDSLNQLVSVRASTLEQNLVESYVYDDSGKRIKKVSFHADGSNETTYYVNDNFLRVVNSSGTFDTVYYFHNGQRVARKDPDGRLFFYHPDHLGSTDLVTDESGKKVEKTAYMPFGEVLSGGESRFTFTGKEMDKGTGLMYYGARYYSPSFKRFTQPDSVIADVYNPQNLNRYSYVMNNPVKYTDPTGKWIEYVVEYLTIVLTAMSILELKNNIENRINGIEQEESNQANFVISNPLIGSSAGGEINIPPRVQRQINELINAFKNKASRSAIIEKLKKVEGVKQFDDAGLTPHHADLPVEKIPFVQKIVIAKAKGMGKETFIATHLLES